MRFEQRVVHARSGQSDFDRELTRTQMLPHSTERTVNSAQWTELCLDGSLESNGKIVGLLVLVTSFRLDARTKLMCPT